MTLRYWMLAIVAISTTGISCLPKPAGFTIRKAASAEFLTGTNLRLVGRYDPLQISLYVDITSTNKKPDFAILQGNQPVFERENSPSNTVEDSYCENGFSIARTIRDNEGRLLKRYSTFYKDGSTRMTYTYFDADGDGLWDRFIIYDQKTFLIRSNLCWVPAQQNPQEANQVPPTR